ncbi:hypothetical protein [Microbacterium oleivorans]|uniref:hypothetical protein n=1 Tax=Microbacterium oleivorans TaxID=273677 RepID=UPI00080DC065|nr:hypothetical protein [Microbacterium oleivorans]
MSMHATMTTVSLDPVPQAWDVGERVGRFTLRQAGRAEGVRADLRVFRALGSDTRYLLDRVGAVPGGPLGRARMQQLPESLAEGVSLLSFDEAYDGRLSARLVLLRRAWDLDIILSARGIPLEGVDDVYDAALDLCAVQPMKGTP